MALPTSFAKMGFPPPPTKAARRLLIGSQGLERTGKSEFYCHAPGSEPGCNGGVAVLEMDDGTRGMIEKHSAKGRQIGVKYVTVPPPQTVGKIDMHSQQKLYEPIWKEAEQFYIAAVKNKDVKTLAVDTGTEFWNTLKLAVFGSLSPAVDLKRAYGPLNAKYEALIRMAYERDDLNLIMTHKVKERYVTKTSVNAKKEETTYEVWDGSYKRQGYSNYGYLIQVNIEHFYDKEAAEFGFKVIDCKQDMSLAGLEFRGPDATFLNLAMSIFPDSEPKEWGF